ncbi:hypothetical protein DFH27DRAFT_529749 [Peziza echinospora]|nr:hypothetical protein DFH27DRAFT_529749 [Peziza echinospora]
MAGTGATKKPKTTGPRTRKQYSLDDRMAITKKDSKATAPSEAKKQKVRAHFVVIDEPENTAVGQKQRGRKNHEEYLHNDYEEEYGIQLDEGYIKQETPESRYWTPSPSPEHSTTSQSPSPSMHGAEVMEVPRKARPAVLMFSRDELKDPLFRGGRSQIPLCTLQLQETDRSFDILFGDEDEFPSVEARQYDANLRAFAESVFNRAARARLDNVNEAEWSAAANDVLKGPPPSTVRNPLFQVRNIKTFNLEKSLVPVDQNGDPLQLCRVDFMLRFHNLHNSVDQLMRKYIHTDTPVSVLGHPHGSDGAISFMPIEVKTISGTYPMALYQILLYSTATTTMWARLRDQANARKANRVRELPPTPSIVVVGDLWYLHWAYYGDGEVIHVGPFDMGNTLTIIGTLKLTANIRKLKHWAEHGIGQGEKGVWERFRELFEAANT